MERLLLSFTLLQVKCGKADQLYAFVCFFFLVQEAWVYMFTSQQQILQILSTALILVPCPAPVTSTVDENKLYIEHHIKFNVFVSYNNDNK